MSQLAARVAGENRARLTLVRLLCAVSIWRTAMMQVLPRAGSAAWWVALTCLLPGVALTALFYAGMRLTKCRTVSEAVRACLGKMGAWGFSVVLAALLTVEGLLGLRTLITLFTQGVGTRGTPFTLALLTGGALLLSLHREGLSRAVYFLRWGMIAAAVVLAACLVPAVRLDHLFPLHGAGDGAVWAAMKAGTGLAWPLLLLLTVPPIRQGRLRSAVLPAFSAVAALLLLTLTIPQELLSQPRPSAECLLLPTKFAPNALRVLNLCLLLLTIFLSIGASVQLATEQLCAPTGCCPSSLPYVLLVALIIAQTCDSARLWAGLAALQWWLLVPLGAVGMICVLIAIVRRKNA